MIWLISILGMILRFWKIGFGLPHVIFGDEGLYVYFALNMGGGFLDPKFYPDLYFYLCFLADAVYILLTWLLGRFHNPGEAWALYRSDPTVFYMIARLVSAILGTLTIPVAYKIGKRMSGSRPAGYLAALFLALSYMHVQYSQIALLDVPLTFFILLSFLFSLYALESGRARDFILSGLAGGLAVSVKYNGLGVLMLGPLLCLLRREVRIRECAFFFAFFLLGFTIGTPYWLLNWPRFIGQITTSWALFGRSGIGHLGCDGNWNWFYYLFTVLPYGLGWPLTIAGVTGIVAMLCRPNAKNILFISFPVLYFLVTGSSLVRAARYIMPVIPFLCVGAAFIVLFLARRIFRQESALRMSMAIFAAILMAFPALKLSRYIYLKQFPDTRVTAYDWLHGNLHSGEKVLQTYSGVSFIPPDSTFALADLDHDIFDTRKENISSLKSLQEYKKAGYEYLLLDEWHLGVIMNAPGDKEKYRRNKARYQAFLIELDKSAKLVWEASPYRETSAGFDPENVQFASRRIENFKRLGPAIRIYKLN